MQQGSLLPSSGDPPSYLLTFRATASSSVGNRIRITRQQVLSAATWKAGRRHGCAGHSGSEENMPSDPAARICVDPRIELFSIIFRLAESPFYIDPGFASYDEAIVAHFAPHRWHPAVALARSLPGPYRRSGPSALILSVQTTEPPYLCLKYPHRLFAAGLDRWWRRDEAEAFLAAARAFFRDTDFDAFLVEQQPFYSQVRRGLERCLRRWGHLEWLDWFFGPTPGRRLHVIAAPLIGDRNYGAQCLSRAEADFYAIIAPSPADVPKRVVFRRIQAQIVMHEFGHSYVNPMVARHRREFRAPGEKLFASVSSTMAGMGYSRWDMLICESLIRAAEVRYRLKYEGPQAAAREVAREHRFGFGWTGALADLLGRYEAHRPNGPGLESYVPRLARFFAAQTR